jgi:protein phosphatase
MERMALISDIHGNMPALEAVLDDIARRGIARILCLGDMEGRGPRGPEVVDRVHACCEAVVRGNWEDGLADLHNDHPLARRYQARLGPDRLAYLAALPFALNMVLSGRHIRLLHASPRSVYEHVFPYAPEERLLAMFENTDLTGDGPLPDIVIYGDTHVPAWLPFGSRVLLNVGSVGSPLDGQPDATYAIIEGHAGPALGSLGHTIVRVPYDVERAIQDAREARLPDWEVYAADLRSGQFTGRSVSDESRTSG